MRLSNAKYASFVRQDNRTTSRNWAYSDELWDKTACPSDHPRQDPVRSGR